MPTITSGVQRQGAQDIAYGGDGAIVPLGVPCNQVRVKLCVGSGCYDWYSIDEVPFIISDNIGKMTMNAFNYLMNN